MMYIPNPTGFTRSKTEVSQTNTLKKKIENGHTVMKSLLVYTKSKGCIYCFVCKLFSKYQTSLTIGGFSDWMNVLRTLDNHEDSMEHKRAMLC